MAAALSSSAFGVPGGAASADAEWCAYDASNPKIPNVSHGVNAAPPGYGGKMIRAYDTATVAV
jgi:hypothetical protein